MPYTIIFTHVKKNSLGIPDVLRGCGEDEGRAARAYAGCPTGPGGADERRMRRWGLLSKRDEIRRHVMTRASAVDGQEVFAGISSLLAVAVQQAAAASRVGPRVVGLRSGLMEELADRAMGR